MMAECFYTVAQLRAMEQSGLAAGQPLMARAGAAAAAFLTERVSVATPILVLVGPGNNGGDALVMARLLQQAGRPVTLLAPDLTRQPADAAAALAAWTAAGGRLCTQWPDATPGVIVDGLFGIGLNRAPSEAWAGWIEHANQSGCPIFALDVPSGVLADTGAVPGVAIRARWTLSFIGRPRGLATGAACNHVGEWYCDPLGLDLPTDRTPDTQTAVGRYPGWRVPDSHKGRFGNVRVLGGAAGMVGAGLIAARAALHAGAGKVWLAALDPDAPRVDPLQPELMFARATEHGAQDETWIVGPGLGRSAEAVAVLERALAHPGPLLLDADALNLLAADGDWTTRLRTRTGPTVMTPHPAEASRLLACSTATVQADRFAAATHLARESGAVVVLKGAGTLVAADGQLAINRTGSAALSNAGQGDLLSGIIGGLLAQGLPVWIAANLGVWAHGAASDACVAHEGWLTTPATTLLPAVNAMLGRWHASR
jgi:hydroxyethylthiazole kinase-like uncharacterized protein yjeF